MNLERIQQAVREAGLDGWLFYDFRRSNPIAHRVLDLPADSLFTRRWFYFVPSQGTPTALVSAVEAHVLNSLPGRHLVFRTWQEMQEHLRGMLRSGARVAMEYSPMNAIPYVSRVDAGTIELVRSYGIEVVSSANLSQRFVAQLSEQQVESHREAGRRLIAAKDALFAALSKDLRAGVALDEYTIQQRFVSLIEGAGLILADPPIVAVNEHASDPHYEATATQHAAFRRGDLILFDFFACLPEHGSVIADYTWMAFAGTADEIPVRQREVFAIVRQARDTGIMFLREQLRAGEQVEGRQVDEVVRGVIASAGYGQYFVHRTGHSITTVVHGDGANNDNYEMQDSRILFPYTCCSIEPGIYLPEFGIRSEVNILVLERDIEVTGTPAQEEIVALL